MKLTKFHLFFCHKYFLKKALTVFMAHSICAYNPHYMNRDSKININFALQILVFYNIFLTYMS